MLKSLQIQNYALINHLEMEPSKGLNMITGETGAGKSIMLGAVGLLMGNRADTKVLLSSENKCIVEGVFDVTPYSSIKKQFEKNDVDYESETIIRREISPSGKSRAFINDQPVTLDVLRNIGSRLIDIHSQHETLLLGSNQFQLRLIDLFAETADQVKNYQQIYQVYRSMKHDYETLKDNASNLAKDHDYHSFLLQELNEAKLGEADQEEMERQLATLENAEEIKGGFHEVINLLEQSEFNTLDSLNQAQSILNKLAKFSEEYATLSERLESSVIELKDVLKEVESQDSKVEHDPQLIDELSGKLSLIYRLQQKHQVQSIDELIKIEEDLTTKVNQSSNLDEEIERRAKQLKEIEDKLNTAAAKLSATRQGVFKSLQKRVEELLADVGITEATIDIKRIAISPNNTGIDQIDILFSANKGVPPQEIKQVASGGEFGRLMFCLKYLLAHKTNLPTVIFDEIDTGVSGEIALKMVRMMKKMSGNHQIISISHLPQFAAQGDSHYYVFKDNSDSRSVSRIRELIGEDRIQEIAKMIGGDHPSETAVSSARELMSV